MRDDAHMPRLQRKSLSAPDLVRAFPFGHVDVVNLDETSVARFTWEPGWRWSKDVAPVVQTTSCQNRHVGYVISGVLHVLMDDGTELEIRAGDAFEIPPGHDAWVVGDEVWDTVEFTSAAVFGVTPDENESVLATILFTDIVDSTATLSQIGDASWRRLVLQHNQIMRTELDRFRGREMGTTGDGFLALFDGAARAVRCANAMTRAAAELEIRIRAGLHTGEVAIAGGQARGLAVHAAARVSALASPGEVLVSSTTHDLLDGSGLSFVSRGDHELKGLVGARTIYALEPTGPTARP
jgi:class 3 adenylate cyclase